MKQSIYHLISNLRAGRPEPSAIKPSRWLADLFPAGIHPVWSSTDRKRQMRYGLSEKIALSLCMMCCVAFPYAAHAASDGSNADRNEILITLNSYYQWVLDHADTVAKSAPGIVAVPGSTKFYLDRSSEQEFIDGFMHSGNFSGEFPAAVSRYYSKYEKEFSGYSAAEFDQMARDGRGPLMEVEDMDIFFCAQEYEYKHDYIAGIRLKDLRIDGNTASVVSIMPLDWETHFNLQKVNGKWLIAGFCVYE